MLPGISLPDYTDAWASRLLESDRAGWRAAQRSGMKRKMAETAELLCMSEEESRRVEAKIGALLRDEALPAHMLEVPRGSDDGLYR